MWGPKSKATAAPKERTYTKDSGRYGPINQEVDQLNIHSYASGIPGYPSDKEYMGKVAASNLERDSALDMERAAAATPKKKKKGE